jgi:alpha-beta hydrolase superfamily lysophospholipase
LRDVVGAQSRVPTSVASLAAPGRDIRFNRLVQSVIIQSAGVRLVGEFHPAPGPAPAAFVVSHGWGSRAPTDIPAALADAGFPTLAYDLRAHGRSSGALALATREEWVADLVRVHAWVQGRLPGTPVGLVGASFGAYLSVLATARCQVASLSLRVPANFADDGFDEPHLARMAADVRRPEDLRPADSAALRALRDFTGPVQIVDADLDDVIPAETVAAYAGAVEPARLTRATLPDSPHHLANPELRAIYVGHLLAWATDVHPA